MKRICVSVVPLAASNRFAFDLFREINAEQPDSNVFLSPLSASMALGMTLNGARNETFDAMRSTPSSSSSGVNCGGTSQLG